MLYGQDLTEFRQLTDPVRVRVKISDTIQNSVFPDPPPSPPYHANPNGMPLAKAA